MQYKTFTKIFAIGILFLICFHPAQITAQEQTNNVRQSVISVRQHQYVPTGEARAIWISPRQFSQEKEKAQIEMQKLFTKYAQIGITDLFAFSIMEWQQDRDWDLCQLLLDEAHTRDIKVHPCISPSHIYPGWKQTVDEHPEWLMQTIKEMSPTLNLAIEDVRDFVIAEIATVLKYDIDGIHLDYVRFQTGQGFSYDDPTLNAFKKEYGVSPLELRWHNCGSSEWCEWLRWNANHVTTLVRGIKDSIIKSGKDIPLSAAVFPDHESAKLLIGQDWEGWVDEGIIDIICPMIYTNNHDVFRKYTKRAVDVAKGKCLVYPGIAISSSHNKNTPQGVETQIQISREENANGFVFYSGLSLSDDFINTLESGIFK